MIICIIYIYIYDYNYISGCEFQTGFVFRLQSCCFHRMTPDSYMASNWKFVPGWSTQNSAREIWFWGSKWIRPIPSPESWYINLPKRISDNYQWFLQDFNIFHISWGFKKIPRWFPMAMWQFHAANSEAEGSSFHVVAQGETNSFATIIPASHAGGDHFRCCFDRGVSRWKETSPKKQDVDILDML